jgi:hypothetical protein
MKHDEKEVVLEKKVTYHAERCTADEQTRQRQALGVLLGYEKMTGEEGDFNHGLWREWDVDES